MKNSEIVQLTTDELNEKIEVFKTALNKQQMNHVVTPLENPMQIRATRKDVARLMTELQKRTLNK